MNTDDAFESAEKEIVLRPRRQVTLPSWVCDALDVRTGDRLAVSVTDQTLVITPRKSVALQALRDIQAAFAEAGITEEALQAEGRQVREELTRVRHGAA